MNIRPTTRGLVSVAAVLIAALALLSLSVLIVNLSWFDEPLVPELAALQKPQPVSLEGNSYASAFGFLAADGRDPHAAGQAIVGALRERHEQGRRIALSPEEMATILGGTNLDASWQTSFDSLGCNARVYVDCAERLIAEVEKAGMPEPRLAVLIERYGGFLRQTRFAENRERDVYTPFPPYRELRNVGRLRLAISYRDGSTREFLEKVAEDFESWVTILRDSETLATKMVAIAGVQDDLDFLSTLLRNRALGGDELEVIQGFLRPFTPEESDIGEAFVSEARIALLSEPHPMLMRSSWLTRLALQENATLNEEYLTVFAPMRLRASLNAREYYRQEAYERLPYTIRALPPPLFNLGGKLALRSSAWFPGVQLYLARVHDQNGRISLVLLQAEIEERPDTAVEDVVRRSTHRNPYTDDPMEYDARAQTVGFECLHTVFHPPAPPDLCRFPIGRIPN